MQLASVFLRQDKYTEAIAGYEAARAIFEQQNEPTSVAAAWHQLGMVYEQAGDNDKAETTTNAWTQARDAYLAYRQQGGYAQYPSGELADDILKAITQGETDKAINDLTELAQDNELPDWYKAFANQIVTIINGATDTSIANDSSQDFDEAAELLFFIERLDA